MGGITPSRGLHAAPPGQPDRAQRLQAQVPDVRQPYRVAAERAPNLRAPVPNVPLEDWDPEPARKASGSRGAKPAEPEPEGRGSEPSLLGELVLLVVKIAFVAGFAAMVLVFLFGLTQVTDESMGPAVREGDLVVYYRLQKDYSAGDLVVVNDGERKEVRRVIAVAGDEVSFDEDGLVINGYHQSEERIFTETLPYTDGITYPVVLGDGQVFVMGDNRPLSRDSRLYGPVDIETGTEGEVMTVIRRRNF